ncbi:MAG: hypothetical protein JRI76_05360 [Deltaproteobacteria bacterium]|nr:hypothetical protein [Deltaproteobacteria bacterium]MBW2041445.1 hypothetical protein [Deltaproteobacteria bacterium]MBW2132997.1 hypothetical protein [Deltaproteobacteria bacterium]
MAFEPEKDKELKRWVCDETGLVVTINQYADAQPKVQIGPRVFQRKDGTTSQRKAGRLAMEDLLWLYEIIDEVKEDLSRRVKPE